jgi:outer membrane lipoprotein-sorting protein
MNPSKRFIMAVCISCSILNLQMALSAPFNPTDFFTQYWKKTHTFSAKVTQSLYAKPSLLMQEMKGTLWLKKGYALKWLSDTKDNMDILVKGDTITIVQKDLNQVLIQKRKELPSNGPLDSLSLSSNALLKRYTISGTRQGKQIKLYLAPKIKHQDKPIVLSFKNRTLNALEQDNEMGQRVLLQFTDTQINQPLPPNTFRLKMPKNAVYLNNSGT